MTSTAAVAFVTHRPARSGVLASLTASLLLSACAQSTDLLPSLSMTGAESETAKVETTSDVPQTELQRATVYWGNEFAKKPTELPPALNYARNLKAMGEKHRALSVLQQASLLHGDNKELAGEYGRLALDLNQVGVAGRLLAVADDPAKPDWRVVSARGTVLAKQGKYSEAVPMYERALELSPGQSSILNNLAMSYAMMGEAKKAEDMLRQASASGEASPMVRENLALVLGLQGRYDESKSVALAALPSQDASANADYLKRLVKIDAKVAAPMPIALAEAAPRSAAPQEVKQAVTSARTSPDATAEIARASAHVAVSTNAVSPVKVKSEDLLPVRAAPSTSRSAPSVKISATAAQVTRTEPPKKFAEPAKQVKKPMPKAGARKPDEGWAVVVEDDAAAAAALSATTPGAAANSGPSR